LQAWCVIDESASKVTCPTAKAVQQGTHYMLHNTKRRKGLKEMGRFESTGSSGKHAENAGWFEVLQMCNAVARVLKGCGMVWHE
jgi:hypothetical protein